MKYINDQKTYISKGKSQRDYLKRSLEKYKEIFHNRHETNDDFQPPRMLRLDSELMKIKKRSESIRDKKTTIAYPKVAPLFSFISNKNSTTTHKNTLD